jgi:hypothetical protein
LFVGADLDVLDAGAVDRLHRCARGSVADAMVSLQEDALFRVAPPLLFHGGGQLFDRNLLGVQIDVAARIDRNDQVLVVVVLPVVIAGDRQVDAGPADDHRRDHHEDDQQDQHDVDQRGYVDLGAHLPLGPALRRQAPARGRVQRARGGGAKSGGMSARTAVRGRHAGSPRRMVSTSSDAVSSMSMVMSSRRAVK